MSERIAAPSAEIWTVIDTTARTAPRVHEPVIGYTYSLKHSEKTSMPKTHAVVFLRDPAFRVFDEAGIEQIPLPDAEAIDPRKPRMALEKGQTIARFDELTDTAMLARVITRPGGFTVPQTREAMTAFLAGAPLVEELPPHERVRQSEGADPDAMTASEAKAALGAFAKSDPLAMA